MAGSSCRMTWTPPRSNACGRVWHGFHRGQSDGCDFREGRLDHADLTGAILRGVRFTRTSLVGARLCGADLTHADMGETDLSRADLTAARLVGTDLTGARLVSSVLRDADMPRARLGQGNLDGADLAGAKGVPAVSGVANEWTECEA